ncbi:MAG: Rieske 2Fe-2S domain-containing protein [Phycisphaeraceae bacterium]|nr:Rieske 2Fe-2S domain-containing protein [Phycisphaeraceae bacterium]
MAETHEEVVKVWIDPGCIVCDACEAECPEVFDVQEETCLIRPDAQDAEFTKPLTPSIIEAAEGCPVDVIKFETVEVEGEPPWAGEEEEAEEEGGDDKPKAKKSKGPEIPDGPPEPKWAGLLAAARTSGSRSAGGPEVSVRSASAPAEAVAEALPDNAPPDAAAAAMVGSGFSRPRRGVVARIKDQAAAAAGKAKINRREFGAAVAIAWGAMLAVAATAGAAFQSFMVPKVTKEPPSRFRAGKLGDYAEPGVYTDFKKSQGVWIVHLSSGKIFALSTICTHLGCIPNWLAADEKFKCPCHGSGFYMNGVNFEGPAPRPLERYRISLEGTTVFVDKSQKYRQELGQWSDPNSFLTV